MKGKNTLKIQFLHHATTFIEYAEANQLFHPLSLTIPLLVLIPNLFFFKTKPAHPPENPPKENPILSVAEGIGRICVFALPVFSAIHIKSFYEISALIGMILLILFYYWGWSRYFTVNREYKLLFMPIMGIPVPMAIGPVLYFLLATVILHSPYMFIGSVILGIGHIPISLNTYYQIINESKK